MLYASNSTFSVVTGDNIPLNTVYLTNNNISWSGEVASIKVPGYYRIHFDITGSPDAAGTITVASVLNGVVSTTALASETSTGAADLVNLGFNTVVKIVPTCAGVATFALRNTGDDSTFTAGNLTIERIA